MGEGGGKEGTAITWVGRLLPGAISPLEVKSLSSAAHDRMSLPTGFTKHAVEYSRE
jgi:hypothetical protein